MPLSLGRTALVSFQFRSTGQPCLLEFIATRLEFDFDAIHIEGQQFYRDPIPSILSLLYEYREDGWSKEDSNNFPPCIKTELNRCH